ncbi:MAG: GDP-mannose 4,6-dehydratase, partial [Candidatus Marinimicrobia bacterium]|nr:GDP-mannose 4,6-dehydratase [Candidatus Neomarinimicrobiota bacterium]
EYCEGMWRMLQQEKPEDFVLATGEQHSVREFVELSFKELDISIDWQGDRENEIGVDQTTGKTIVGINSKYYRPTEVETLLGDASKAKEVLGWEAKTPFSELVKMMVQSDWKKVKKKGY